ncbi:unnamed protein product, partial [Cylicocyclus nassatus]
RKFVQPSEHSYSNRKDHQLVPRCSSFDERLHCLDMPMGCSKKQRSSILNGNRLQTEYTTRYDGSAPIRIKSDAT